MSQEVVEIGIVKDIIVDLYKEISRQINIPLFLIFVGFILMISFIWRGYVIPYQFYFALTVGSIVLSIYEYFKLHKLKNEEQGKVEKARKFEKPLIVILVVGFVAFIMSLLFYDYSLVILERALGKYGLTKDEIVARINDTGTLLGPALVIYTVQKNYEINKIRERMKQKEEKESKTGIKKNNKSVGKNRRKR